MTIPTKRSRESIWTELEGLPDEEVLTVKDVAQALKCSTKTLGRMRKAGTGPEFHQTKTAAETKARNQPVKYLLGDLKSWLDSQKRKSSLEVLRFDSIADVMEPHPFWIKTIHYEVTKIGLDIRSMGKTESLVIGHLLTVPDLDQYIDDNAESYLDLVFISLSEAMKLGWADSAARKPFHNEYVAVLQNSIDQSNAQQEAAEIRSIL